MPQSSALPRGARLRNGAYAIGERLGRGGFGTTHKGGDVTNKNVVVIKDYLPHGAQRQENAVVTANADDLRAF